MKRIFIIDDNDAIVEALTFALEAYGYEVRSIRTWNGVRGVTGTAVPDVILLDLLLSGTDGKKVARELRSAARTRNIPIIMLSAHPGGRDAAKQAGVDGYLAKPFDIQELTDKIEAVS
ncbi:hypothetical protein A2Z33_06450 [Candidatus Gottesmanbacteria bacterium RBG_16_52_11]|uniref:Response regulatory domain-containing protein n=1 Tax=Candidatus Gottesmanbacteria bacterium RBG_16_52_11 TaxID=1798374 RepID=A0A1F5YY14_9BACT|nr:MAG: hypothetical protein A2Z33_06450 [Candidatus Gottesmanbacteria bacterium RBG_16_52_11]